MRTQSTTAVILKWKRALISELGDETPHRVVLRIFSALTLLFAVGGVVLKDRAFVKLGGHGIYVLEGCALALISSAVMLGPAKLRDTVRGLPWIVAFFLFGVVRTSLDLVAFLKYGIAPFANQRFALWGAESFALQRFAQHCLLFVYPVLWATIGFWFWSHQRRFALWAVYLVFILNVLVQAVSSFGVGNLFVKSSLGSLLILVLISEIYRLLDAKKNRTFLRLVGIAGIAFLCFSPYLILLVQGYSRRTSTVLLIGMILLAPWAHKKVRPRLAIGTTALALGLLAVGLCGVITFVFPSSNDSSAQVIGVFQHGEDKPRDGVGGGLFQARTRRFLWAQAVEDWKPRWLLGVGFIPEVPSRFQPHLENDGHHCQSEDETPKCAPLSGPHNSYLSILARMGVIGAAIFLVLSFSWLRAVPSILSSSAAPLARLLCVFVPFNGAVHSFFNVGLESPHNAMLIWLFVGFGMGCLKEKGGRP